MFVSRKLAANVWISAWPTPRVSPPSRPTLPSLGRRCRSDWVAGGVEAAAEAGGGAVELSSIHLFCVRRPLYPPSVTAIRPRVLLSQSALPVPPPRSSNRWKNSSYESILSSCTYLPPRREHSPTPTPRHQHSYFNTRTLALTRPLSHVNH
jgi:hypothetical protein